jgi:hypothetical protein
MKRFLCVVAMLLISVALQVSASDQDYKETEFSAEDPKHERFDFTEYNVLKECEPFDVRMVMSEWKPVTIVTLKQNRPAKMYQVWYTEKVSPHSSGFYMNPETGQVVLVMTTNGQVTVYGFRNHNCYFN